MRFQFALHGHAIPLSREEYDQIKGSWTTTPIKDCVIIQLAVVGPDMCIAFLDKNKLIQITCVPLYPRVSSSGPGTWYDSVLAPCPIMDLEAFITNLRLERHQRPLRHPNKTNPIYFEIAFSQSVTIRDSYWEYLQQVTSLT